MMEIVIGSIIKVKSAALFNTVMLSCLLLGIKTEAQPEEWFQMQAVLRVSLGNFLFFAIFALIMIGVKDQNDRRDAWHHGGWMAKMVIWILLVVLMFFLPNVIFSIYGELSLVLVLPEPVFLFCFSLNKVIESYFKPW